MRLESNSLPELSDADLTFWLSVLHTEKKSRRFMKTQTLRNDLRSGDEVTVNHKRAYGKTFIIERIKQKKAFLKDKDSGVVFDVSISLIEAI